MSSRDHARFDAAELAIVLSHYDLGVIESITDFPRGSRRSPKVGIVAQRGKFLLKRRSLARVRLERIRFTHEVQAHLMARGFPSPALIPTRSRGAGFLQMRDYVYELFAFVPGETFRRTTDETRDGGELLSRFHALTEDFTPSNQSVLPTGDYHDTPGVRTGLCSMGTSLKSHDSFTGDDTELALLVQDLFAVYERAADHVNQAGFESLPERIIHADWHPGNLVFRNQRVIGVIDYDAMRMARRIVDVANGALQFSMLAGGDPVSWPDDLDQQRFEAFLTGYQSAAPLTGPERACLVPMMIEALIGECVPPITRTGSLGRWAGYRALQMIKRKATWMEQHAEPLTGSV